MRKLVVTTALAGAALVGLPGLGAVRADTYPNGLEGCIAASQGQSVANPGGPAGSGNLVNKSTCSFTAKKGGGFVAVGTDWSVTVYDRPEAALRKVVHRYTTANMWGRPHGAYPGDAPPLPAPCMIPAYVKGQFVVVNATEGVVYTGDPYGQTTNATLYLYCRYGK